MIVSELSNQELVNLFIDLTNIAVGSIAIWQTTLALKGMDPEKSELIKLKTALDFLRFEKDGVTSIFKAFSNGKKMPKNSRRIQQDFSFYAPEVRAELKLVAQPILSSNSLLTEDQKESVQEIFDEKSKLRRVASDMVARILDGKFAVMEKEVKGVIKRIKKFNRQIKKIVNRLQKLGV